MLAGLGRAGGAPNQERQSKVMNAKRSSAGPAQSVRRAERDVDAARSAAKQAKRDLKRAKKAAKEAKRRLKAAKKKFKAARKEFRRSKKETTQKISVRRRSPRKCSPRRRKPVQVRKPSKKPSTTLTPRVVRKRPNIHKKVIVLPSVAKAQRKQAIKPAALAPTHAQELEPTQTSTATGGLSNPQRTPDSSSPKP